MLQVFDKNELFVGPQNTETGIWNTDYFNPSAYYIHSSQRNIWSCENTEKNHSQESKHKVFNINFSNWTAVCL